MLPTGRMTEDIVKRAAAPYEADVHVFSELASFLSPNDLLSYLIGERYDMVLVSGMCTASFQAVEDQTGVPIFKGPRHAADLSLILPYLGKINLSREIPADDLILQQRREEAYVKVQLIEEERSGLFSIRGLKIGAGTRIKVLAEIMDAHKQPDLIEETERFIRSGADIIDLGFGFDATPEDVTEVFTKLMDLPIPLAIDTQEPELIRASLFRADLILSLQERNLPHVGRAVAKAGICAVIIPGDAGLATNVKAAKDIGVSRLVIDPILHPAGSGLVKSLCKFTPSDLPVFFGAGNVIELIDADSVGMTALLASIATECDASIIFCSEHSDKTNGCVTEMRRATEMMVLAKERPYPKDLGVDLFSIKEKRRRREPALEYKELVDARAMPTDITYDRCGNFRIGIEDGYIIAVLHGKAIRGRRWQDLFSTIALEGSVSLLDHAAYLGAELYKAELALRFGRSFEQDGPF